MRAEAGTKTDGVVRDKLDDLALSESGFLFDPSTGHTYTLNPTAAFLLRELIDGEEPQELGARLASRFEADAESAAQDAEQFLQRLRELGVWREGKVVR